MSKNNSPSQVSEELRRIATIIESSKNPSLELVTKDIASVAKKLQGSDKIDVAGKKIAGYMFKIADEIEELDVSAWDTEEGEEVEAKYDNAKQYDDGDKLETGVKMLKRAIDKFLKELMDPGSSPSGDDNDVVTSAPPIS